MIQQRFFNIAILTSGTSVQAEIIRVEKLQSKSGYMYRKFHVQVHHQGKRTVVYDTFFVNQPASMARLQYLLQGIYPLKNWDIEATYQSADSECWEFLLNRKFIAKLNDTFNIKGEKVRTIKYLSEAYLDIASTPAMNFDEDSDDKWCSTDHDCLRDYTRRGDFIYLDGEWFHEDQF